jgi:molybdopterin converting factor small subunit
MARIHIPALLQDLTHRAVVDVEIPPDATFTVGQLLERLDASFPGLQERLLYRGDLVPGIAVFVDGEQGFMKLLEKVHPASEVHFLPPIVGGSTRWV